MTFEWTPELQLQAAQNALAYVSIVQFSRATNDAAGRDAVLTSVLNDFTDAGVSEEDAMSQLFSGLTTVANLAVEVGARRSGVSPGHSRRNGCASCPGGLSPRWPRETGQENLGHHIADDCRLVGAEP
ncbi:hypothetical protein SKC41_28625 [Mycobacterium sp. 050128]|uniref:hypothetical protein n=1 Tax=Mycobacterium sp. 050128 TaxID=3096112 RepID=UPI002ED9641F